MEYYIKRIDGARVEIAKFDGGDQPKAVYNAEFYADAGRWKCGCPAGLYRKKECKHIPMLQLFVESGEPVPFILGE
jgi:hypothetical protein